MTRKYLFRFIKGRIVPMKIGMVKPTQTEYKASAAIRKGLRKSISARTSLREKRMGAVRRVRVVQSGLVDLSDYGAEVDVFKVGGWVVKRRTKKKSLFGIDINARAQLKSIMSKHKMAPETFLVKTSRRDYIVQKQAVMRPDTTAYYLNKKAALKTDAKFMKAMRSVDKLSQKASRIGIKPGDIFSKNIAMVKGRPVYLDSGAFTLKREMSESESKRFRKFTILSKKKQ